MIDTDICTTDSMMSRQITETKGCYSILEYNRLSGYSAISPADAFFRAKQGIKKKQVIAQLDAQHSVILQGGAIKGIFNAKANNETAVKPKYSGDGVLVLEPTWKYILLEDLDDWGGSIVLDDGLFLSCESTIQVQTVMRNNLSSAIAGGEGLFNTMLSGRGVCALESNVPRNELVTIELQNDTVKIDGNMAIAWSGSLQFTVERSMKGLIGSAVSGEGLVNVYRGTGRILVAVT